MKVWESLTLFKDLEMHDGTLYCILILLKLEESMTAVRIIIFLQINIQDIKIA